MSYYRGPAILLDGDGNEATVDITIVIDTSESLKSWSAQGTASHASWDLHSAEKLRLPDGKEGQVVVNNVSFSSTEPTTLAVSMLGSGQPPA